MDTIATLVERRSALRALGLGVTALAAGNVATEAKRKKRRKNRKNRKQGRDQCPAQVATCEASFAEFCSRFGASPDCQATIQECCAPFGACDAGSAINCFVFRFLTK